MGVEPDNQWHRTLASALEWWDDAGVDTIVDDAVRDWLARPAPLAPAPPTAPAVAAAPEQLPGTVADFIAWRISDAAPEAGWTTPRIAPAIVPDARLAVMIDMPEAEDEDALWQGPAGGLFDKMLAAIGLARESVQLVPLAFARPVSGQLPGDQAAQLIALADHFLSLARPPRLLLLGQAASRAVLGTDAWPPDNSIRDLNHHETTIQAVATFHPRLLIERPALKRESWKHLLLMSRGTKL
ncbi:uracil-DNA glycosylase family protein [Sphingomonas sp. RS6]